MSGSSPAGGLLLVRLAVLAAVTATVVDMSSIIRSVGSAVGAMATPAAAAEYGCGAYEPVPPSGGVVRRVSTQAELTAALAAAHPGDVVNLADGVYSRIDFQADRGHRPGTASAPIVIQAAAGATPIIDAGDNGTPSRRFAVSIIRTAHVKVRGLEIRNGIFGALSRGSASITFEHNHIHHVSQVGVVTGAAETAAGHEPSSNTVIRCNRIHHTGMLDHEFGEGIYVGTGGAGAVDRTSGVLIEGNEIHSIANEAVDVKRYTTDVTIRQNLIHDITPYYGGAISLGLNKNNWGPANYLVEENAIWNVSSGRYYAQAIAVAHGPTVIRNNTIWNVDTRISDSWPWTATIQVHGDDSTADWAYGFGNPAATRVEIVGNTIIGCNQGCINSFTDPGQITPALTVRSNIVDRSSTGAATNDTDIVVTVADLVGPVTGTADGGAGPGSGLRLSSSPPPTPPTTARPPSPPPTTRRSTTEAAAPSSAPRPPVPSTPPSTAARTGSSPTSNRGSAAPTTVHTPELPTSVGETSVRSHTTSTSRSRTGEAATLATGAGRRRTAADLRVFLDANLGPDPGDGNGSEAAPQTFPDVPWLLALTAPSAPDERTPRRTPTTVTGSPTGPAGNATTVTTGVDTRSSNPPAAGGDLPSTTQPSNPPGLTSNAAG